MPSRRQVLSAAALATAGALSGCAKSGRGASGDPDALHIRVWDEKAADAYRTALKGFRSSSGLDIEVEAMPWEDYWSSLPLDIAGKNAPDLLWMNTANLAQLQRSESIMDLTEPLAEMAGSWEGQVTDQYRIDGKLWGAPQFWDRTILLSNRELVDAAKVDPEKLSFDPGAPTDPLRDAAKSMTKDANGLHPDQPGYAQESGTWGIGTGPDRAALLGPFVAANGGTWQNDDGSFAFASAEGIAAVQYLADLALTHKVTPPGPDIVAEQNLCRQRFTEGRLGLLQTGTYALGPVHAGIAGAFGWSVHPPIPGPRGPRPLVHAIAFVATSTKDDDREQAIIELAQHLASADVGAVLAQQRIGIPARHDQYAAWVDAWKKEKVDVSGLGDAPTDIAHPEMGIRAAEAMNAAMPPIVDVFTGKTPAAKALPAAQAAADKARG